MTNTEQERRHELVLFADYFQFYVCDVRRRTDTGTIWDETASDRILATGPDLIAVGTARNMNVPLSLELLSREPSSDFDDWEQIVECSLSISSGKLIALGCTDMAATAPAYEIPPGCYRARVSHVGLDELSEDGLDGKDRYRVQLWPGEAIEVSVIKRRATESCPRL